MIWERDLFHLGILNFTFGLTHMMCRSSQILLIMFGVFALEAASSESLFIFGMPQLEPSDERTKQKYLGGSCFFKLFCFCSYVFIYYHATSTSLSGADGNEKILNCGTCQVLSFTVRPNLCAALLPKLHQYLQRGRIRKQTTFSLALHFELICKRYIPGSGKSCEFA